jgi:hypothetical protein
LPLPAQTFYENKVEERKHFMNIALFVAMLLALAMVAPGKPTHAQSCNPAVVSYLARDPNGQVLSVEEMKAMAASLPKSIGEAQPYASEVSFKADGKSYYWPEDADWPQGRKLAALEFANAAACAMRLSEVTLEYQQQRMRLIFNLDITRTQPDRRLVIDALPFQPGVFKLDMRGWTHSENEVIPATRWKQIAGQKQ